LGATASPTVPLAFPLCPEDTTIQLAPLVALQVHPLIVATSTASVPPAAAIPSPARLSVNTHGAAAWLMATLCVSTMIAPAREDGAGLAATVYWIEASPCPPASAAIDTQFASVLIDHVQSRAVAIVTDPCPPDDENDVGALATLTWHLAAVAGVGAVVDVVVLVHAREAPETATASAVITL
jgi:hypothetical protein